MPHGYLPPTDALAIEHSPAFRGYMILGDEPPTGVPTGVTN